MSYEKPKLISPNNGDVDIGSTMIGVIGKSKTFV